KGSFDNLLQSLTVMGLETELELVSVEMEPSSEEVQIALGLDAGERVQRAVRLRRLEQAPFSHLTTFVPESIASTYTEEDLAQTPMLTLLERAGAAAVQADQTLSAAAASPAVAEALDISPAAPVFEVVRTLRDRDGRAVQLIHVFYRADRFKYEMRLTKQADGEDAVWRSAD
ncbi:MAG: UTRA domain-containing protein, partial [Pseudomonadota bacterium]